MPGAKQHVGRVQLALICARTWHLGCLDVGSALAQFERSIIHERTNAGLKAALAQGRKGRRRPKVRSDDIRAALALLSDPQTSVRIPVLKARMSADLHMAEDLKNNGKGNLFVIFGEPDITILNEEDGRLRVKVNGVDVFKPQTREVIHGRSRTLRVNYRTSHQIRTQADRLLGPIVTDV
jgi:hypothetical protein